MGNLIILTLFFEYFSIENTIAILNVGEISMGGIFCGGEFPHRGGENFPKEI
jgi:hypothetical protein